MLSAAEIGAVLDEIRPVIVGGRVQKVAQPTDSGIILDLRNPGRTLSLMLSAHPETARLHIQHARLPNPPQPPAFCQILRARILGARLTDIRQWGSDRIVELHLEAQDGPYLLVGEFFGLSANLVFADGERKILATLRPVPERRRTSLIPPSNGRTPPPHLDQESRQRFLGSPPSIARGEFPISRAIESYYGAREVDAIRRDTEQQRLLALRRAAKKLARRVEALTGDLQKAHRYESYVRYGELLKANLGHLRKGQQEVQVTDYFDEAMPTLTLPLDPAKSPQANMHDYFQKHRKFLNAQREIAPRLAATRADLSRTLAEIQDIERGVWSPPEPPSTPVPAPGADGHLARRPKQGPARKGPFRRFQSSDGYPIYVGRNAKENEELTHRFASSEDLWLHARGVPGSHVVVRLPKGTDVPPETLRDAATLALLYSDLRKSGKGEVIYTRKKWVKKAKGQAAGTVIVTQEKSVHASMDRDRLERMKARAETGEG